MDIDNIEISFPETEFLERTSYEEWEYLLYCGRKVISLLTAQTDSGPDISFLNELDTLFRKYLIYFPNFVMHENKEKHHKYIINLLKEWTTNKVLIYSNSYIEKLNNAYIILSHIYILYYEVTDVLNNMNVVPDISHYTDILFSEDSDAGSFNDIVQITEICSNVSLS